MGPTLSLACRIIKTNIFGMEILARDNCETPQKLTEHYDLSSVRIQILAWHVKQWSQAEHHPTVLLKEANLRTAVPLVKRFIIKNGKLLLRSDCYSRTF